MRPPSSYEFVHVQLPADCFGLLQTVISRNELLIKQKYEWESEPKHCELNIPVSCGLLT